MVRLKAQGKIGILEFRKREENTIRRAHKVHPMAAVQTEYSLWTRDVEPEILPLAHELGIGFVAYSPLGRGFLTGTVAAADALPQNDARRGMPRFQGGTRSRTKSSSTRSRSSPRTNAARRRSSASHGSSRASRRSFRWSATASGNGWRRTPRPPSCGRPRRRSRRSTRRSSPAQPRATVMPHR